MFWLEHGTRGSKEPKCWMAKMSPDPRPNSRRASPKSCGSVDSHRELFGSTGYGVLYGLQILQGRDFGLSHDLEATAKILASVIMAIFLMCWHGIVISETRIWKMTKMTFFSVVLLSHRGNNKSLWSGTPKCLSGCSWQMPLSRDCPSAPTVFPPEDMGERLSCVYWPTCVLTLSGQYTKPHSGRCFEDGISPMLNDTSMKWLFINIFLKVSNTPCIKIHLLVF